MTLLFAKSVFQLDKLFKNSWVARYVMDAMLDDDDKAFLISFSCLFIQHGGNSFVLYSSRDSWSRG